ncbi:MAG TPA: hypothetical protein VLX44_14240 [Xanthobacteraceae bacterium]|nr:hypothetical protein [Xanthobacteraceae bacterium]
MEPKDSGPVTEIPWRTDEHGILLGARVHDATLVKLIISKERLVFVMRRLSDELVTVELLGLRTFTIQELWDMPIVSEFWVWKVGSVAEAGWSVPDGPWNILFSPTRSKPPYARREAAKIAEARPDAFLVQLTCSYGGAVAAICDRVRVLENGQENPA